MSMKLGREVIADVTHAYAELAGAEESWVVRMARACALQHVPVGLRWGTVVRRAGSAGRDENLNLAYMIWYAMESDVAGNPERAMQIVEVFPPRIRRWMARRMCEHSSRSVALLFESLDRTVRADVLTDLLGGFNDGLAQNRPKVFRTVPTESSDT